MREFIYNWLNNSNVLYHPELKVGEYYEIDEKFLYCNFQELVDFVEIECARAYEIYNNCKSISKRDSVSGIKYLELQTSQEVDSKYYRVIELYNWWIGYSKILKDSSTLPNLSYDKETEKLIELMRVRDCLWT